MGTSHRFPPKKLPIDLGKLGKILELKSMIPGVYTASMKIPGERIHEDAYFLYQDCPHISDEAKRYGKPVPDYPGLLMFIDERTSIPSHIVDYEVLRYKRQHNIPSSKRESLRGIASCGAELYPEYFGAWPPPYVTPWGITTRYRAAADGIFFLETNQLWRGLAVSYIQSSMLSFQTIEQLTVPDRNGTDEPSYLFFQEKDACIAFFELILVIERSGYNFSAAALKNAICQGHPEYAEQYNEALRSMGRSPEFYITPDPSAGTVFFEF